MRKDKWPELPPGYAYQPLNSRIYISYPQNGLRQRMRVPNSVCEQYWMKPESASLAAWKHAYEQLKEEKSHVSSNH